jgi:hypothetical protein
MTKAGLANAKSILCRHFSYKKLFLSSERKHNFKEYRRNQLLAPAICVSHFDKYRLYCLNLIQQIALAVVCFV